MSKVFRMTQKAHESMSVNSKSMSKISDNASDGSFNNQYSNDNGSGSGNYLYPKKKKKNASYPLHHFFKVAKVKEFISQDLK